MTDLEKGMGNIFGMERGGSYFGNFCENYSESHIEMDKRNNKM